MFDIETESNPVRIKSFDIQCGTAGNIPITIYARNTYVPHDTATNQANWMTILDTTVSCATDGGTINVGRLTNDVYIPAFTTYGFYIYVSSANDLRYYERTTDINGNDINIKSGNGINGNEFGGNSFQNRIFSGRIYYEIVNCYLSQIISQDGTYTLTSMTTENPNTEGNNGFTFIYGITNYLCITIGSSYTCQNPRITASLVDNDYNGSEESFEMSIVDGLTNAYNLMWKYDSGTQGNCNNKVSPSNPIAINGASSLTSANGEIVIALKNSYNVDNLCFSPGFLPEQSQSMNVDVTISCFPPTKTPTTSPTNGPTKPPTPVPTFAPTPSPTDFPSPTPTNSPTPRPTLSPTLAPNVSPTKNPTGSPSTTPTNSPTIIPTTTPTISPTLITQTPTKSPTSTPTLYPTTTPTSTPTQITDISTTIPTTSPSLSPTFSPTNPTQIPSPIPTKNPTNYPSYQLKQIDESNIIVIVIGVGLASGFIILLMLIRFIFRYFNKKINKQQKDIHKRQIGLAQLRSFSNPSPIVSKNIIPVLTENDHEIAKEVAHFEKDIYLKQTKGLKLETDKMVAQELQNNNNDLYNLTKGNIKSNVFTTNDGQNNIERESQINLIQNDSIIARELNHNYNDLYNLTKGNILPNDFVTVKQNGEI